MTNKELQEKLKQFPDDLIVGIEDHCEWDVVFLDDDFVTPVMSTYYPNPDENDDEAEFLRIGRTE